MLWKGGTFKMEVKGNYWPSMDIILPQGQTDCKNYTIVKRQTVL